MTPSPRIGVVTRSEEGAIEELFERHRRELHVHCYRMTGSFLEA